MPSSTGQGRASRPLVLLCLPAEQAWNPRKRESTCWTGRQAACATEVTGVRCGVKEGQSCQDCPSCGVAVNAEGHGIEGRREVYQGSSAAGACWILGSGRNTACTGLCSRSGPVADLPPAVCPARLGCGILISGELVAILGTRVPRSGEGTVDTGPADTFTKAAQRYVIEVSSYEKHTLHLNSALSSPGHPPLTRQQVTDGDDDDDQVQETRKSPGIRRPPPSPLRIPRTPLRPAHDPLVTTTDNVMLR